MASDNYNYVMYLQSQIDDLKLQVAELQSKLDSAIITKFNVGDVVWINLMGETHKAELLFIQEPTGCTIKVDGYECSDYCNINELFATESEAVNVRLGIGEDL